MYGGFRFAFGRKSALNLASARPARLDLGRSDSTDGDSRIVALDGLRGVLALMVCISHYFAEVAHGFPPLMVGWIAVKMFFVLSGYLMARIILANMASTNFATVFYVRRACRTLPVYLVTIGILFASVALFGHLPWMDAERIMPLWSYLTFTQSFVMIARNDLGSELQLPTWTLTVEEQFYLIAPLICILTPRRHLIAVLVAGLLGSLLFRAVAYGPGAIPAMAALILLPGAAHSMFLGMIAAVLLMSPRIDWARGLAVLRFGTPIALFAVAFTSVVDDEAHRLSNIVGIPLASLACTFYLMAIVLGAPEAERFKPGFMRSLGRISFSLYLLHMPVLGLMHGLIFNSRPDIATLAEIGVTLVALPMTILLAWLVNRYIEQPMITYGRTWRWAPPNPEPRDQTSRARASLP